MFQITIHEIEGAWDLIKKHPEREPTAEEWERGERVLFLSHVGASIDVAQYSFFGSFGTIICRYVLVLEEDHTYCRHAYCYPWYAVLKRKNRKVNTDYQINNSRMIFL